MPKYMLIFNGGYYENLSAEQTQKQMEKWTAWIEKLRTSGKYHSGEPLTREGMKVTGKNGKLVVDGPFAESKESVGGFIVLEASTLQEATEMAKEYPDYSVGGSVSIRPVMKMDMTM